MESGARWCNDIYSKYWIRQFWIWKNAPIDYHFVVIIVQNLPPSHLFDTLIIAWLIVIIFYKTLNYLQIRYNKIVSQVFPIVLDNLSMRVKYHPLRRSWPSPCGFASLSIARSNTLFSFYCQYLWWLSSFWRFKSVSDLGHAKVSSLQGVKNIFDNSNISSGQVLSSNICQELSQYKLVLSVLSERGELTCSRVLPAWCSYEAGWLIIDFAWCRVCNIKFHFRTISRNNE